MKSVILFFASSLMQVYAAKGTGSIQQSNSPLPRPVREVYGEANATEAATKRRKIVPTDPAYGWLRSPGNCSFPLDIVIVQDATASFDGDYKELRERQLKNITDAISESHPGSRVGVVSFKDKPLSKFGDNSDYCFQIDLALTQNNLTGLNETYKNLESSGGGDPAENQLGALIAAAQSKTIGWNKNSLAAKLLVVVTDAPYHYDADGLSTDGMVPFTGEIDFANAETQCISQYYPSPSQVKTALTDLGAYLGTIVDTRDSTRNSTPGIGLNAWRWLNTYLGQPDAFVNTEDGVSTSFGKYMAKIIASVERSECTGQMMNSPAPPCATGTGDDCPAVDINWRHRPLYFNIQAE